jgi:hypothetical protein
MALNKQIAMILYNVTVNIDNDVHDDWLTWMKEVHIPEVMATGYFLENKVCRIMAESEGGTSYAIQYLCASQQDYEDYQQHHAPALQQKHLQRYNGKFGAFRTLLEVVHTS